MDKFKEIILKYKYYVAGFILIILVIYLMRSRSSGNVSIQQPSSTAMIDANGNASQVFGDPTVLLAQMASQNELAKINAQTTADFNIAKLGADLQHFQIETNYQGQLAGLESDKWMAGLNANTNLSLKQLDNTLQMYTADTNLAIANNNAKVQMLEIDAGKYITERQYDIAALNANTEMYKAKTDRRGQNVSGGIAIINAIGKFFK